eukprot:gene1452-12071_t
MDGEQDKLIPQNTVEEEECDEEDFEDYPEHVAKLSDEELLTVQKLEEVQDVIEEINFSYEKEIELLNQKYGKLKKPHLQTVQELVEGKKDGLPKIPCFWLQILKNSGLFAELEGGLISITKEDEESLSFLKQITVKEEFTETHQTFTLDFHFEENPFFANEKLTKVFSKKYYKDYKAMIEDTKHIHGENCDHDHEEDDDEVKPTGTKIEWKEGKNLQMKLVTKVLKGNKKKNKTEKKIQKLEKCETFYNFFDSFDDDETNEEHWEVLNELRSDILQDPFYYYMETNDDEYDIDEDDDDEEEE